MLTQEIHQGFCKHVVIASVYSLRYFMHGSIQVLTKPSEEICKIKTIIIHIFFSDENSKEQRG